MNPFHYTNYLQVGRMRTVVVADTNYQDGTFVATDSPMTWGTIDAAIQRRATFDPDSTDFDEYQARSRRLGSLAPGTATLVRYIDQRLYRAFVLRQSTEIAGEFEVYFVDYGNVWCTRPEHCFPMDPALVQIPVTVFRCKLAGANDDSARKMEMIASYLKELTNVERTLMTIVVDAVDEEKNLHFVQLYQHSMEQYFHFNKYINRLVAKVIDEKEVAEEESVDTGTLPKTVVAVVDHTKEKAEYIREEQAANSSSATGGQSPDSPPSNYEALTELISHHFHSTNVLTDDLCPLVRVTMTERLSPVEFYAVPQLKRTEAYHRSLADDLNKAMRASFHSSVTPFTADALPSSPLAYYHKPADRWHRGQVLKVELNPDYDPTGNGSCSSQNDCYTIRDFDLGSVVTRNMSAAEAAASFQPLPPQFQRAPGKAIRCVMPFVRSLPPRHSFLYREMCEFSQHFLATHADSLYILPLEEVTTTDDASSSSSSCSPHHSDHTPPCERTFVVGLYHRKMMLTGMFQPQKQRFESFARQFLEKFADKLAENSNNNCNDQVVVQFAFDNPPPQFSFTANIYRNLCSVSRFDQDLPRVTTTEDATTDRKTENPTAATTTTTTNTTNTKAEDQSGWDSVRRRYHHHKRAHYPNSKHFPAVITHVDPDRENIYFRLDCNESVNAHLERQLAMLAFEPPRSLPYIAQTLTELQPAVVWDAADARWYRCEVLALVEQKQATWLPRILVHLLDTGARDHYLVEDIRDRCVAPDIPAMAVPAQLCLCSTDEYYDDGDSGDRRPPPPPMLTETQLEESVGKRANIQWINFPSLPMAVTLDSVEGL